MLHISRRGGLAELADAVYTVDDASDKGRGRKRQVRLVGEWGIEVLIAHLADAGTADQELASYRAAAGFLESASRGWSLSEQPAGNHRGVMIEFLVTRIALLRSPGLCTCAHRLAQDKRIVISKVLKNAMFCIIVYVLQPPPTQALP